MVCIKTVSQEKRAIAKSTIKVVTKKSIRKKPIKKENYKITKKNVSNFQLGLPIKNTLNSNDNSDVIYSFNSVSMSDKPEFIGGTEAFEFFKDGTLSVADKGMSLAGKYSFVDDTRIKLELGGIGALAGPQIATVSISGGELSLTDQKGKVSRYKRAK